MVLQQNIPKLPRVQSPPLHSAISDEITSIAEFNLGSEELL